MHTLLDDVRQSFLGIDAEAFQELPLNAQDDTDGATGRVRKHTMAPEDIVDRAPLGAQGQWQTMHDFMRALSKRFDTFCVHVKGIDMRP